MRIALISDIHGNELALNAVLEDIAQSGADQTICLGDVATLGPCPEAVVRIIRERKIPCVLGNHDAFMFAPHLIHSYTEKEDILQAVEWCRSLMTPEDLEWMQAFPMVLEVLLEGTEHMAVFHGSPGSNVENILARTPGAELDRMTTGQDAGILACGHTHIQMLRQHRGVLVVNPGSVGLPFREFMHGEPPTLMHHAEYALVESLNGSLRVDLRRVSLDKKEMHRAAESCANPLRPWLMEQYS